MDIWQYLEIAGVAVGLLYLYFEYQASVWLWLTGIIMPAIYVFVYYESGFYADMGINVYYLFAGFYGWAVWLREGRKREETLFSGAEAGRANAALGGSTNAKASMPITRTPTRFWLPLALIAVAFFAVISYILVTFTDSTVPFGDSFTTALSIVGLWMLARKYVEQWLVWIVVDVVCSALYFYKGLYPTGALYGLYSVIAVFGYYKWLRIMKLRIEN